MMENIELIKNSIKELATEQIHLSSGLRSMMNDTREIKNALLGDQEFKRPGIIHEFEEMKTKLNGHADEIKAIKDQHFKTTATVGAVSAGAGIAGGMGLKAVLIKIFSIGLFK